jgi:hypothetical protein
MEGPVFPNNPAKPHSRPIFEKILVKKGWHFSPFCCIINV